MVDKAIFVQRHASQAIDSGDEFSSHSTQAKDNYDNFDQTIIDNELRSLTNRRSYKSSSPTHEPLWSGAAGDLLLLSMLHSLTLLVWVCVICNLWVKQISSVMNRTASRNIMAGRAALVEAVNASSKDDRTSTQRDDQLAANSTAAHNFIEDLDLLCFTFEIFFSKNMEMKISTDK